MLIRREILKKKVAIKIVQNSDEFEAEKYCHLEVQDKIEKDARYKNTIMKLIAYNDEKFYLVTKLMQCGNLKMYLSENAVELKEKLRIAFNICYAIIGIHEAGYIHGDIAARNILVKKNEYGHITTKLSDFGCAQKMWVGIGPCAFADVRRLPPEVILAEERQYKASVDTWAFGLLLWELWTDGETEPFGKCKDYEEVKELFVMMRTELKAPHTLLEFPPAETESEHNLKELIQRCLTWNSGMRISIWVIKSHKIFQDLD